MKVAIVGCGIGGLAAASFLSDAGHVIEIFDQFDEPAAVGSGLVIQPVGLNVLRELNIANELIEKGACGFQMLGLEAASGRKVLDVSYGENGGEFFGLGIHRASLFDGLLKAVLKRNISINQSSKVLSSRIADEKRYL